MKKKLPNVEGVDTSGLPLWEVTYHPSNDDTDLRKVQVRATDHLMALSVMLKQLGRGPWIARNWRQIK